jgi:uncharacterized protein YicC (UPF0701 family)
VQHLTLQKLSEKNHDLESLGRVMTAVMHGVREDAQQKLKHTSVQTQASLAQITDAVAGLDAALAQLAEASKLAVEEAAGRAEKFSHEELARARTELESLEALFLDTLKVSASAAKGAVADTLHDLLAHAKRNGTAVGSQLKDTLAVIAHQMTLVGHTQFQEGIHFTQATADLMRKIAAGLLTGIAERVKPGDKSKKHNG